MRGGPFDEDSNYPGPRHACPHAPGPATLWLPTSAHFLVTFLTAGLVCIRSGHHQSHTPYIGQSDKALKPLIPVVSVPFFTAQ
jgi:hypothetical protein